MSARKKKDYDYQFKVVMIGDTGVGKSSILKRFVDGSFSSNASSTLDVDFKHRIVNVGKHRVKLNIWDTAGQEQYNTITTAYYRGAEGIFIVYDVASQNSLKHISQWVREVDRFANEGAVRLIAGNKVDLKTGGDDSEGMVPSDQGIECAKSLEALFFETSAKEGVEVERAFEALAVKLIAVKGPLTRESRASTTVRLENPAPGQSGGKVGGKASCC